MATFQTWQHGLSMFAEFEKLQYPSVIPISARFYKSFQLLPWNLLNVYVRNRQETSALSSTISFLMISYFIVARHIYDKLYRKFKSQFQVIFGQDSFPLKMGPFQVSLSQNSTNCLLANGWWHPTFTITLVFSRKFPISSCKCLVCRKIFLVRRTDSFGGLHWLFFHNH